jgi:hypothetical protein
MYEPLSLNQRALPERVFVSNSFHSDEFQRYTQKSQNNFFIPKKFRTERYLAARTKVEVAADGTDGYFN